MFGRRCRCGDSRCRTLGVSKGFCSDFMAIAVGTCRSGDIATPFIDHSSYSFAITTAATFEAIGAIGHYCRRSHHFGSGCDPGVTLKLAQIGRVFDSKSMFGMARGSRRISVFVP